VSDAVIQPRPAPITEPPAVAAAPATPVAPASGPATPAMAADSLPSGERPTKGSAKPSIALDLAAAGPGDPPPALKKKDDDGWKIRFNFGFNRTHYFNSDVKLRGPMMNVDIKDMAWKERTSASYYNPANWTEFQNAFQWIDEPTNTFQLSATKGKNEFILSAFHPKFLANTEKPHHVKGDINGVAVDGMMPLFTHNDGNTTGALHIPELRNTHMQMDVQVGYGREFELFKTKGNHSLVYRPAVYAGVVFGKTVGKYETAPGVVQEWEDKTRVHGASASLGNKLEFRFNDRVSLMAEHKITAATMSNKVYGGTMKYNMVYSPIMFGVGVKLWDQDKHRKP
jgi:hypothetical protein